jgi:hypothetical protein
MHSQTAAFFFPTPGYFFVNLNKTTIVGSEATLRPEYVLPFAVIGDIAWKLCIS